MAPGIWSTGGGPGPATNDLPSAHVTTAGPSGAAQATNTSTNPMTNTTSSSSSPHGMRRKPWQSSAPSRDVPGAPAAHQPRGGPGAPASSSNSNSHSQSHNQSGAYSQGSGAQSQVPGAHGQSSAPYGPSSSHSSSGQAPGHTNASLANASPGPLSSSMSMDSEAGVHMEHLCNPAKLAGAGSSSTWLMPDAKRTGGVRQASANKHPTCGVPGPSCPRSRVAQNGNRGWLRATDAAAPAPLLRSVLLSLGSGSGLGPALFCCSPPAPSCLCCALLAYSLGTLATPMSLPYTACCSCMCCRVLVACSLGRGGCGPRRGARPWTPPGASPRCSWWCARSWKG